MQHLDEGTIHSWLDGALSAEEAARTEAHVKECPECAVAVAEARGFIAASSRILTALDNAPRGVIPAVAPKKRIDPVVWRIAATLLVVAGGTLVVARNSGNERSQASTAADSGTVSTQVAAPAPANEAGVAPAKVSGPAVSQSAAATAKTTAAPAPMAEFSKKTAATDIRRENVTASQIAGALSARPPSAVAPNAPALNAPLFAPSRAAGVVIADADAAAEQAPPRVVGTPRAFGEKRTLYEVAPGDTVLLAEVLQTRMEAVVVTGAAGESRQPMSAPAISPQGRTLSAGTSNGVTTITWIDPATGTTMKLSGRHSREELEGIRRRIEQARATAAPKKNP